MANDIFNIPPPPLLDAAYLEPSVASYTALISACPPLLVPSSSDEFIPINSI